MPEPKPMTAKGKSRARNQRQRIGFETDLEYTERYFYSSARWEAGAAINAKSIPIFTNKVDSNGQGFNATVPNTYRWTNCEDDNFLAIGDQFWVASLGCQLIYGESIAESAPPYADLATVIDFYQSTVLSHSKYRRGLIDGRLEMFPPGYGALPVLIQTQAAPADSYLFSLLPGRNQAVDRIKRKYTIELMGGEQFKWEVIPQQDYAALAQDLFVTVSCYGYWKTKVAERQVRK